MRLRKAITLTVLVLAIAAIASAPPGMDSHLERPCGRARDLQPGDHRFALQGSIGVITDVKTSKSFTVLVWIRERGTDISKDGH